MNERDKIVEIIRQSGYGYFITHDNADTEQSLQDTAKALIENGIGDISEWKEKLDIAEKAGKIIQRGIRVFGTDNHRVEERIDTIWNLAKKQAEKEIEEEQRNEQD